MSEREEIVAYLRSQADIHHRLGTDSWAKCLRAYADLIETQPARQAMVDELVSRAQKGLDTPD